uniref:Uncharacterized protein n=1 Tax=Glossina brevipalpis TaxID=37001 RepID=A0A1A9WQV0_9MUSC
MEAYEEIMKQVTRGATKISNYSRTSITDKNCVVALDLITLNSLFISVVTDQQTLLAKQIKVNTNGKEIFIFCTIVRYRRIKSFSTANLFTVGTLFYTYAYVPIVIGGLVLFDFRELSRYLKSLIEPTSCSISINKWSNKEDGGKDEYEVHYLHIHTVHRTIFRMIKERQEEEAKSQTRDLVKPATNIMILFYYKIKEIPLVLIISLINEINKNRYLDAILWLLFISDQFSSLPENEMHLKNIAYFGNTEKPAKAEKFSYLKCDPNIYKKSYPLLLQIPMYRFQQKC